MTALRRFAVCAVLISSLGTYPLGATRVHATATAAADIFDTTTVQDIHLLMNARDLQTLRERFNENTYYPADLQWRDHRVRNIGVRSRGLGSRNAVKLGLRLDFNHYVSGQRFVGMSSLVLDNLWQDPAMIREALAMSFITRMGEPASRESFARVYLNGELQGLYAIVEEPNADYLAHHLGDPSGVLFEFTWRWPYWFESLGDHYEAYEPLFERRTHQREAAAPLYQPLLALVAAVNQPLDAVWRDSVERYVDLAQVVRYAAIEAFLAESDGLASEEGINNFYLYRPLTATTHQVLPWDRDHAFSSVDRSVFEQLHRNILLNGALAHSDLMALYLSTLERCAAVASDDRWLETEVARFAALAASAGPGGMQVPYAPEEHEASVQGLHDFSRRRADVVRAEIARVAVRAAARAR